MSKLLNTPTILTEKIQTELTPEAVIEILKEGNKRFQSQKMFQRDHKEHIDYTSSGQYPFAAVLGCIDSRVPVETVFDLGIGDVFSVRVAGNVVNNDILGSLEYACKVAGSKVILVLGHTNCGAVKSACDYVELGNITEMLAKISPAVEAIDETENRTSENPSFVQKVAIENVKRSIDAIKHNSPVIRQMCYDEEVLIVGAMYDVETGKVTFID